MAPGISARFIPAGHVLGAAQIALNLDGRRLHFTGDLGRSSDALMKAPAPFEGADVLVCESTYGNRRHPAVDADAELAPVIQRVAARGGVIVIPAFAIGRAQGLMLHIARLAQAAERFRTCRFISTVRWPSMPPRSTTATTTNTTSRRPSAGTCSSWRPWCAPWRSPRR